MYSRNKGKKREIENKIKILVEGSTEKYYFESLLKELKPKLKVDLTSLNGGGYRDFKDNIEKNRNIYDIVLIITDLDKAADIQSEKEYLIKLLILIEKENEKNNIFLTNRNIEDWLIATLPNTPKKIEEYLGYSGSSKGKNDIFKRIRDKKGDFHLAINKFKEEDLFFLKKDFKKGIIVEENLRRKQSNLIYFKEYLKLLNIIE